MESSLLFNFILSIIAGIFLYFLKSYFFGHGNTNDENIRHILIKTKRRYYFPTLAFKLSYIFCGIGAIYLTLVLLGFISEINDSSSYIEKIIANSIGGYAILIMVLFIFSAIYYFLSEISIQLILKKIETKELRKLSVLVKSRFSSNHIDKFEFDSINNLINQELKNRM